MPARQLNYKLFVWPSDSFNCGKNFLRRTKTKTKTKKSVALQVGVILMIAEARKGLAARLVAIFEFACARFIVTCATRNWVRRRQRFVCATCHRHHPNGLNFMHKAHVSIINAFGLPIVHSIFTDVDGIAAASVVVIRVSRDHDNKFKLFKKPKRKTASLQRSIDRFVRHSFDECGTGAPFSLSVTSSLRVCMYARFAAQYGVFPIQTQHQSPTLPLIFFFFFVFH